MSEMTSGMFAAMSRAEQVEYLGTHSHAFLFEGLNAQLCETEPHDYRDVVIDGVIEIRSRVVLPGPQLRERCRNCGTVKVLDFQTGWDTPIVRYEHVKES